MDMKQRHPCKICGTDTEGCFWDLDTCSYRCYAASYGKKALLGGVLFLFTLYVFMVIALYFFPPSSEYEMFGLISIVIMFIGIGIWYLVAYVVGTYRLRELSTAAS